VELLFDPNLDDHGRPRGLAATLDPSDVIVGVKRGYITIRKNRLHVLRFPRISTSRVPKKTVKENTAMAPRTTMETMTISESAAAW
jgi:hypothetical protein